MSKMTQNFPLPCQVKRISALKILIFEQCSLSRICTLVEMHLAAVRKVAFLPCTIVVHTFVFRGKRSSKTTKKIVAIFVICPVLFQRCTAFATIYV